MTGARVAVGVPALAVLVWWAIAQGGYDPVVLYPGALVLLAILAGTARPASLHGLPRETRWALAALAGFVAWSYCSIAWAGARGDAWQGANRALVYLIVFALFAIVPWRAREARAVLAALAVAIAGAGALTLLRAAAGHEEGTIADGRLAGPIGYANATAGLLLVGFWLALVLVCRPHAGRLARGALLAAAGVAFELLILAQSRGTLLAGAVTLALAVALVPETGRLAAALAAVGIAALASLPALLAVYGGSQLGSALDGAAVAIGLSCAVLFAAGWFSERVDARIPAIRRPSGRVVGLSLACVVAAAGVLGVAAQQAGAPGAGATRFTSGTESGRYDFWRVALREFAHHPAQGRGADNFAREYARHGHRFEQPLYPHSVVFGTLAETGLVGAALLAGFLVAAVAAVRRLGGEAGVVAVAAVVGAAAFFAHAAVDWLWEVPALGAAAMACLGLIAGLGREAAAPAAAGRRAALVAAGVLLAGAAALAVAFLAARDIEGAARQYAADPAAARQRLDDARRLDPLSDRADVVAGALALESGRPAEARRAFARALDRDRDDWLGWAALGVLDLDAGRAALARRSLERARALVPRDRIVEEALAAARGGAPNAGFLAALLADEAIPGPLGRRPVSCRPVLALRPRCP